MPMQLPTQLRRSVEAIEHSLQYRRSHEPIDDHLQPEPLKEICDHADQLVPLEDDGCRSKLDPETMLQSAKVSERDPPN
jgi:hypothetical protein